MGNEESDRDKIIKLEAEMKYLTQMFTDAITRLEKKLDHREENYVTKDILEEKLKQRDKEIESLKESKRDNKNLFRQWVSAAISLAGLFVSLYLIIKGMN